MYIIFLVLLFVEKPPLETHVIKTTYLSIQNQSFVLIFEEKNVGSRL